MANNLISVRDRDTISYEDLLDVVEAYSVKVHNEYLYQEKLKK